ncbi:retron system putative HNH endonuclease [Deinococcus sp. AJ005]|uniref:retron system putative HNH endonuclease n=1 Tax=Deinococcus sp. AJ005 TaxID=2652443 RepID=UPI00125CBE04|nr:retron system putative HNH endonuclease [Deinococcus sp. AJ005]QFP75064.1 TIGR02646 family protein [Deinococcus sp. AJ005]
MRQVIRLPIPTILRDNYQDWTDELCQARTDYYADLHLYKTRAISSEPSKPKAKTERYAHKKVKENLIQMFGKKCAYCESKVDHVSYRQVEHFRPQSIYPSLAYKWENLLFACQRCNCEYKNASFPINDGIQPTENASNPYLPDDLDDNLLIDPCSDNPDDHIDFSREIPVGKTVRGQYSIAVYGLWRDDLNEERRNRIREIQAILALYINAKSDKNQSSLSRCELLIKTYIHQDSIYSAYMITQVKNSLVAADFLASSP